MDLERVGTEERVGDFRADIFAKELEYGKTVIIEIQAWRVQSQVPWPNHYVRGRKGSRLHHLDQSVDLFLIEIELWRIGDSKIAPKFNIIEKPSQWGKEQKGERLESAAGFFRKNFWSAFCYVLSSGGEYRRLFTWGRSSPVPALRPASETAKAAPNLLLFFAPKTGEFQKEYLL